MSKSAHRLSTGEIGALVGLVNQDRSAEAESNARSLLGRYPEEGMLWKILSVALVRQGKDALTALRRTAELLPGDAEAHRNLASACQARSQWTDALASLHRALELEPRDADGFAEAGDAMRALGRTLEAVPLYERALLLNPQLVEARNNLGNAHLELQQHLDAARCYRLAAEARPNNPVILSNLGNAQRLLGESEAAVASFRGALALTPSDALTLNHLGQALRDLGRRRDAAAAFERAIAADPSRAESHCNLGSVLFDLRRVDAATECFRRALAIDPIHAPAHFSLGLAQRQQRKPADAEASCRAALAIDADYVDALAFLGELHADRGDFTAAEQFFSQAIALNPRLAAAYASIATHRKMTADDIAWLRGAEAALAEQPPLAQAISLCYALGKYFDDVERYDDAFAHYRHANEMTRHQGARYDRAKLVQRVDALIQRFDASFVRRHRAQVSSSQLPVFIIGMPRSGTSLAEQILASHPAVFGAGEVIFWNAAYDAYRSAKYPLGDDERPMARLADDYLAHLSSLSGEAQRVIDKMPANFFYAGLIHAALPNARIIHMLRHPADTCLSIYFQNFFNIGPYANDLADLAHYFGEYRRITDHWRAVLPGTALLEVPYEALTEDQEGWTRRMVEFIGLPWDPKCLDFHRTERVVITASKWQVRQKMHAASAGRWRHYEKHLGPLLHLANAEPP